MPAENNQNPDQKLFNPLDKQNLGKSVSLAMLAQPIVKLADIQPFIGAGVYAIYYKGNFELYNPISAANKEEFAQPIYAGKAVPAGARKGENILDSQSGKYLYKRLCEHKESIEQAVNLDINDFYCRYLVVDDIWIPLGESLLIQQTKPLWNNVLDGFGNHDPGKGRYNGQRPLWDILHPGRKWAEKLSPGKSLEEIERIVQIFLRRQF